ncbi:arginase family protein [Actinocrispum sp. NPDC049592]|uniref:arginase family protein n=1 Tax=Actinocrispum sp. NPDC049592 TaxID=3154835 RepID=UPI0034195AF0
MNRIAVLDAPSNLGLRMPGPGVVPGCYKLAGAIRDQGLLSRLGARDAGYVVPPRYDISAWTPDDGIYNSVGVASYTRRLASRIDTLLDAGEFPVVLGGDCSILLAPGVSLRRRGRYGLAYLDGSADFLRLTQAGRIGAAAGETLALATGRGQASVVDIDGLGPYFQDSDVVVLGNREDDGDGDNLAEAGIACWTSPAIQAAGPADIAEKILAHFSALDGFWVHLDADVLDISVLPAVDAPDPGGLQYAELIALVKPLIAAPGCVGFHLTIYDPDLDPDGRYAAELTDAVVEIMSARTG